VISWSNGYESMSQIVKIVDVFSRMDNMAIIISCLPVEWALGRDLMGTTWSVWLMRTYVMVSLKKLVTSVKWPQKKRNNSFGEFIFGPRLVTFETWDHLNIRQIDLTTPRKWADPCQPNQTKTTQIVSISLVHVSAPNINVSVQRLIVVFLKKTLMGRPTSC